MKVATVAIVVVIMDHMSNRTVGFSSWHPENKFFRITGKLNKIWPFYKQEANK